MIEDTIAKIEARLRDSEALTDDQRRELQDLLASLKSEVSELSKTHAEQAEDIAGFTERSTHEATQPELNSQLLNSSLDDLTASVEKFEQSHPKLVEVVNSIAQMLSNVGI